MNSSLFSCRASRCLAWGSVLILSAVSAGAQDQNANTQNSGGQNTGGQNTALFDPLCETGECAPAISETQFGGRVAYTLTDGKSEAVIVPSLGRVMRYGLVNGANQLWVAPPTQYKPGEWRNMGGDKTWPAPQTHWATWQKQAWPPAPAWDSEPHQAEVLSGGRLRTYSGVGEGIGARVVREYGFNAQGEFVIEQAVEKLVGPPVQLSIWSVTQIVPPDAIFLPTNPQSPFKNNFHWLNKPQRDVAWSSPTPTLLQVQPHTQTTYKIGVDAPVAAIAAVNDGVAFVQRAARPEGEYPDGALGAGFPLELWNNIDPHYNELEILSPLRTYKSSARAVPVSQLPTDFTQIQPSQIGTRWKHTIRWSLHRLPSADVNAPEVQSAVEQLFAPSKAAT
ncbi:MAG: hypothetical protein JWN98_2064 [Abditibacteriota bacterium]|nr:hypothetical protein [Abditibacteriota bacterium]